MFDMSFMDINNKTDTLESAYYKKYEVFCLVSPDGIIDSVAGLENLSHICSHELKYRTIICHECLNYFECEVDATYKKCPKCKRINAIDPEENLGKKVLMVVCYHCKNRNITNVDSLYLQCYACNCINVVQRFNNFYQNYLTIEDSSDVERLENGDTRERGHIRGTAHANGRNRGNNRLSSFERLLRKLKLCILNRMCKCIKERRSIMSENGIHNNNGNESENRN